MPTLVDASSFMPVVATNNQRNKKMGSEVPTDNLTNRWGVNYIVGVTSTDCTHSGEVNAGTLFLEVTKLSEEKFLYYANCHNSGTANALAVSMLTSEDAKEVLVGVGTFVSGGDFIWQLRSSASSDIRNAGIARPERCDRLAQATNIPLPYYFPVNGYNEKGKKHVQLEDDCLFILQLVLMQALARGRKVGCLIMELMLQSCGAILTKRFCKNLAELCMNMQVHIIVDEQLTLYRAHPTHALLTLNYPQKFVEAVTFITCGAWLHCGLILRNRRYDATSGCENFLPLTATNP